MKLSCYLLRDCFLVAILFIVIPRVIYCHIASCCTVILSALIVCCSFVLAIIEIRDFVTPRYGLSWHQEVHLAYVKCATLSNEPWKWCLKSYVVVYLITVELLCHTELCLYRYSLTVDNCCDISATHSCFLVLCAPWYRFRYCFMDAHSGHKSLYTVN